MDELIKTNNELIREALKNVIPIKEQLEKDLRDNYSDEKLNKLIALNKEIEKAERLLDCTLEEGAKFYAEHYPDRVDENGKINEKGIKRLGELSRKVPFLRKKINIIRFFKK